MNLSNIFLLFLQLYLIFSEIVGKQLNFHNAKDNLETFFDAFNKVVFLAWFTKNNYIDISIYTYKLAKICTSK
jgi:hypothetical protein